MVVVLTGLLEGHETVSAAVIDLQISASPCSAVVEDARIEARIAVFEGLVAVGGQIVPVEGLPCASDLDIEEAGIFVCRGRSSAHRNIVGSAVAGRAEVLVEVVLTGGSIACTFLIVDRNNDFRVEWIAEDGVVGRTADEGVIPGLNQRVCSVVGVLPATGIKGRAGFHAHCGAPCCTAGVLAAPALRKIFLGFGIFFNHEIPTLSLARTGLGLLIRAVNQVFAGPEDHTSVAEDKLLIGEGAKETAFRNADFKRIRIQLVCIAVVHVEEEFVDLADIRIHGAPVGTEVRFRGDYISQVEELVDSSSVHSPPAVFDKVGHAIVEDITVRDIGVCIEDVIETLHEEV